MKFISLIQQVISPTRLRALAGSLLIFSQCAGDTAPAHAAEALIRPPAVPLVACDPYFSIWSPADHLTDANTTHWTGRRQRLACLVRIDGVCYRVMGGEPAALPALPQAHMEVLPTRTLYTFSGAGITLNLAFMTAALPEDLDLLSRPVTYLTWSSSATDGHEHAVSVYFDARPEITVEKPEENVTFSPASVPSLNAWRVGSAEQLVLQKKGDDLRIDWGYLYLAAPQNMLVASGIGLARQTRANFAINDSLPALQQPPPPTGPASGDWVIGCTLNFGKVGAAPVSRWLMLAYDDVYSIQYMHENLRPYWRRHGWEAADLLAAAARDYDSLGKRCSAFDEELMGDLRRDGGESYAELAALAFRQCFAAGKIVADDHGQPMQFCKENHSNGCISTSDVFYPMAPQFLLFGPSLAKSFVVPFMNYATSDRWKFPYAPHDLGTYPKANGQVYGGGEHSDVNQMPVEESANLLLIMCAIAEMEGNADFAGHYWPKLTQWAEYLKSKGFDPENQLCTDDFAGHLAHNVNLSAKAICALGAYGRLCEMRGDASAAASYFSTARECTTRWIKEADDGDHFRLAFDRTGTWSQKYNLIWDQILGLKLFPAEVATKETAYYRKMANPSGLPLDSRKDYTKLDWTTWTATLSQNPDDFHYFIGLVVNFLNETPDRVPMCDWYETKTARAIAVAARPVVGGVFARMLYDHETWKKYASRDVTKAGGWAPLPIAPPVATIIPAADEAVTTWNFTTSRPATNWFAISFDDTAWQHGAGAFGTTNTAPPAVARTSWPGKELWLRRMINLPAPALPDLEARVCHLDDAEIYINGTIVVRAPGWVPQYEIYSLNNRSSIALHPGPNLVAVHYHGNFVPKYFDLGFVTQSAK